MYNIDIWYVWYVNKNIYSNHTDFIWFWYPSNILYYKPNNSHVKEQRTSHSSGFIFGSVSRGGYTCNSFTGDFPGDTWGDVKNTTPKTRPLPGSLSKGNMWQNTNKNTNKNALEWTLVSWIEAVERGKRIDCWAQLNEMRNKDKIPVVPHKAVAEVSK